MNQDVSRGDIPSGRGEPSAGRAALAGERGAGDDVATTVNVLNQALTIAHITVLRCKRQYRIALRHHSPPLAAAALEHSNGAKEHVGRVTERIVQLGGKPNASPDALPHRSRIDRYESDPVIAVISEHLLASRDAVESYREFTAFFASFDPATHQLIEEIAAGEQARGNDLAHLHDQLSNQSSANHSGIAMPK